MLLPVSDRYKASFIPITNVELGPFYKDSKFYLT